MKKEEIILIGGGGHCRAAIDVIEAEGRFKIAGILDRKEKIGTKVLGYEIIGTDSDLPGITRKYKNFLITVGQIESPQKRKNLFAKIKGLNLKLATVISPYAYISRHSQAAEGTIILHGARINANVKIGKNCIINTSAIIEHDCRIGDHCHISTGSIINGECAIGDGVFIGSNSVVVGRSSIAQNSVVGAGSVVINSINQQGVYAGNPAVILKENA